MSKEIKISSTNIPIKIDVFNKEGSCVVNLEKDLTRYYSELAKKWAVSDIIINKEDFSAKYYAQKAKQNIESAISELKLELSENIDLVKEQVDIAKEQVLIMEDKAEEQVNLAKEAADKAQEIAQSLDGNFSNINLSNINEEGKSVIKNLANEVCISLPIGSIVPIFCSNTYIPEGLLPCDGAEYTQDQFSNFYTNYLVENRIMTCSYEEYSLEISKFGKCAKFGLDIENAKFKVPTISDGTFIQSAMSDDELGKSYNDGLPNINGYINGASGVASSGAFIVKSYAALGGGSSSAIREGETTFDASLSNNIYGNSDKVQPNAVALRYFVVIATGSINQAEMDWSAWGSSLEGKLNADHSNDIKPYIIETYINGASGYLVYSNGFCEQWGQHPASSSNLVLLKPYKDTNYMFNVFARCLRNIAGDTFHSQIRSKTSSQVEIYVAQYGSDGVISSNYIHEWFAVGYID